MNKLFSVAAIVALTLLGSVAVASPSYVGASLGTNTSNLTNENQSADIVSVVVGQELSDKVAVEGQFSSISDMNGVSGNKATVSAVFTPITYKTLAPYVGFGVGVGQYRNTKVETGLVLDSSLGLRWNVSPSLIGDLGYTYSQHPNLKSWNKDLGYSSVNLGLKFKL